VIVFALKKVFLKIFDFFYLIFFFMILDRFDGLVLTCWYQK
jgi:hypothetical protein